MALSADRPISNISESAIAGPERPKSKGKNKKDRINLKNICAYKKKIKRSYLFFIFGRMSIIN